MMNDQGNGEDERKVFSDRQEWDICGPESRLRDRGQFEEGLKKRIFSEFLTYYDLDMGES